MLNSSGGGALDECRLRTRQLRSNDFPQSEPSALSASSIQQIPSEHRYSFVVSIM